MSIQMLLNEDWVELPDARVQDIGSGVYRVSFSLRPTMPVRTRAYDNKRLRLYRGREALEVLGECVNDGQVTVVARI